MGNQSTKPVSEGRVTADGPALDDSDEPRQVTIWFRNIDGTKGKLLHYLPHGADGGYTHWAAQIGVPCFNLTMLNDGIMD